MTLSILSRHPAYPDVRHLDIDIMDWEPTPPSTGPSESANVEYWKRALKICILHGVHDLEYKSGYFKDSITGDTGLAADFENLLRYPLDAFERGVFERHASCFAVLQYRDLQDETKQSLLMELDITFAAHFQTTKLEERVNRDAVMLRPHFFKISTGTMYQTYANMKTTGFNTSFLFNVLQDGTWSFPFADSENPETIEHINNFVRQYANAQVFNHKARDDMWEYGDAAIIRVSVGEEPTKFKPGTTKKRERDDGDKGGSNKRKQARLSFDSGR